MKQEKTMLTKFQIINYGMISIPLAVVGLPLSIYLPAFYAQDIGLSLTTIGLVLMMARSIDIFTDPLIGWLSDYTLEFFGGHRPWIFMGVLLMGISIIKIFIPKGIVSPWYLFRWVSLFYLGWTLIKIPYFAWGVQLSDDYHQRSKITGWREFFHTLGLLFTSILPAIIQKYWGGGISEILEAIAYATLLLLILAIVFSLFVPSISHSRSKKNLGWRQEIALISNNNPFKRLFAMYLIGSIGTAINVSLFVLFVAFVLKIPDKVGLLLLLYFGFSLLGTPLIVYLGRKLSKHRALVYCYIWAVLVFAFTPLLGEGDYILFVLILVLAGLSSPALEILGTSMMADVVDLDTLQSGRQRSALYISLWTMGYKMATAFGIGIALPLLERLGFNAKGNNSPEALLLLTFFYCVIPIILWLVSIIFIWNFPINKEKQESLRQQIKEST